MTALHCNLNSPTHPSCDFHSTQPCQASAAALGPKCTQLRNVLATGLGSRFWLLPALSVRQRVLLLTCDEGGAPHRAAVTVPKPAHRGWRGVRGATEAMVGLGLCSERWGWAPHRHGDRKLVSECKMRGGICLDCVSQEHSSWQGLGGCIQPVVVCFM